MDLMQPFTDPVTVARYAESTPQRVPGFADLHRMAMLLLAEKAPEIAKILVVGAGGGLELKALAEAQPNWRFHGVDPSSEMLDLARRILGPLQSRAELQQAYVDDAPAGPFDGATCLFTLHFLKPDARAHALREIHRRLRPGAAFVVAHHSIPEDGDFARWFARLVAFAGGPSAKNPEASGSAAIMAGRLPVLSSNEDEKMLRDAGFSDVALFYAGLSFRGWVATA